MALEDNVGVILQGLPEQILQNVSLLITILQAAGIFFIFYIIFSVINILINRKRVKDIQNIKEDVAEIKLILRKKR